MSDLLVRPEETEEQRREALDHQNAVLDTRAVLQTSAGQRLFKFLFKTFGIGDLPPVGSEGNLMYEHLGFLRAGKSFFDIAGQANAQTAGTLLAEIKKEEYERIRNPSNR